MMDASVVEMIMSYLRNRWRLDMRVKDVCRYLGEMIFCCKGCRKSKMKSDAEIKMSIYR
jgi:hypothetical protein